MNVRIVGRKERTVRRRSRKEWTEIEEEQVGWKGGW
jgi:hypothetical protein